MIRAALVVLLASAPAAAVVTVTSEVSRAQVAMNEQLVLSVTVAGDQTSLPAPTIPPMEAFSVYASGQSQNYSFINGHMSSSVVYTYVLSPRSVGKFQIPAITAAGAAPAAAIGVEVFAAGAPAPTPAPAAAPAAAPAPGSAPAARPGRARTGRASDVFVTAALDRTRAYVNQQVTLTVRFMNAVQLMGNPSYDAPQTTGFLSEEFGAPRNGLTQIDGRSYAFTEIKTALFPAQSGRLTIGPATIHCAVARMGGGNGQDFFDRFFAMTAPEALTLNSDPIVLQVDPLPAGKPDDFTGVVGKLAAKASVDRASVKAGEAVTITVAVSGAGDVKTIPEPKKPDLPSLRFFDTESSVVEDKAGDRIGGTKTFRTVAVPRVSGPTRLPPFTFSYFDPEKKTYGRAETAAIELSVAPGAPGAETPPAGAAPASAPALTQIGDDIRYLKTPRGAPLSSALAGFADLGPWHAAPLALFLAAALAALRRRMIASDPRGRRFREALARAEARLTAAAALPAAEAAAAAARSGEALAGFVADKLDVPAAGLTAKTAAEGLKALTRPPSDASLARLLAAWEEADLRRFAPGAAADAQSFASEVAALLKTLDQELRR